MKFVLLLALVAVAAAAPKVKDPCTPDPVQNAKITEVTPTEISFSFDEPANVEECPVREYVTSLEKVQDIEDFLDDVFSYKCIFQGHPFASEHFNGTFTGLDPDTKYKVTTVGYSYDWVSSTPVILNATTDPE